MHLFVLFLELASLKTQLSRFLQLYQMERRGECWLQQLVAPIKYNLPLISAHKSRSLEAVLKKSLIVSGVNIISSEQLLLTCLIFVVFLPLLLQLLLSSLEKAPKTGARVLSCTLSISAFQILNFESHSNYLS